MNNSFYEKPVKPDFCMWGPTPDRRESRGIPPPSPARTFMANQSDQQL